MCSAFNICHPYWTLELGGGWGWAVLFTCGTGSSLRKGGNRSAQEGQSLCSGLVCRWTKKASWKTGTREVVWDWTEEKMGSYCRKEEKSLGCDGERGLPKGRPVEWVLKAGVKHVGFVPRGLGSYAGSRQEKIRCIPWKGVSGCLVWETGGAGALRLGWAS